MTILESALRDWSGFPRSWLKEGASTSSSRKATFCLVLAILALAHLDWHRAPLVVGCPLNGPFGFLLLFLLVSIIIHENVSD